jgi:hypothetical protein
VYVVQILTSDAIHCFSRKLIACAPLVTSGIQKALTQLKGIITDHLEDDHKSIHFIVHNMKDIDQLIL